LRISEQSIDPNVLEYEIVRFWLLEALSHNRQGFHGKAIQIANSKLFIQIAKHKPAP
jgi:hypothetical protein